MANLKYRWSKTRTRSRRANFKVEAQTFVTCSNCGTPVLYHHVCPECGFYKGKQVIEKN
ncbi:MAG: 50S ribosomal protein L32 [Bacteroidales bacterium]|jgi:large subunit ribosomal protein L32|nr:50S ribosomal protein L32 [Bacteroidales bacterium]